MNDDISKSALSLAILGLLSLRPLSGYDLRKIFTTTPMGHFSTSPGAVYPALRRLEGKKLIRGKVINKGTLRPKQTFVITPAGMACLKEVLSQPVTADEVTWRLDGLMLRFAFMGRILGRRATIQFLTELAGRIAEHVRELKRHLETNRKTMPETAAFAVEHGIISYQATLQWARSVVKKL